MKQCLLVVPLLFLTGALWAQPMKLPAVQSPSFRKDTVDITAFGAIADGRTLATQSINAAINACAKKGGGVVRIPAGFWLTGPIVLKSNINLHLDQNALLQFTRDFNAYPLVKGNWEGSPQMRNQSPVSATDATNIAITGSGIIDGNGDAWRMVRDDKMTATQWRDLVASGGVLSADKKTWYPSEKSFRGSQLQSPGLITAEKSPAYFDSVKDFLRPNLVVLTNCRQILLEGVTFQNSPAWNLHPLLCEELTIRNVNVKNPWYAQNGDGIDIESCKNVLLENSVFDVGDDGICIKSGRDEEGRKRNKPTENVTVRHCTVYHAHGGFVIGSEMSGGAKNISVTQCSFIGTDVGLRFKTTRGRGGIVENIQIDQITMKDIVGDAILFDMYYMAKDPVVLAGEQRELPKVEFKPVDESTPVFQKFQISHVYCNGAARAIFVRGIPEMHVKEIMLGDMVLQARKGIEIQEASGVVFRNIQVFTTDNNPVIDIVQSDNLLFDNVNYKKEAVVVMRVAGDRSKLVLVRQPALPDMKSKIKEELGAQNTVTIQ